MPEIFQGILLTTLCMSSIKIFLQSLSPQLATKESGTLLTDSL